MTDAWRMAEAFFGITFTEESAHKRLDALTDWDSFDRVDFLAELSNFYQGLSASDLNGCYRIKDIIILLDRLKEEQP